jgi:hypothetical protein
MELKLRGTKKCESVWGERMDARLVAGFVHRERWVHPGRNDAVSVLGDNGGVRLRILASTDKDSASPQPLKAMLYIAPACMLLK